MNRVVHKAFGRLTKNIAEVEATTVQNTRQAVEIGQEMAQLTAEVHAMRLEASGSRDPPPPQASSTTSAMSATFSVHTPRPDYTQER